MYTLLFKITEDNLKIRRDWRDTAKWHMMTMFASRLEQTNYVRTFVKQSRKLNRDWLLDIKGYFSIFLGVEMAFRSYIFLKSLCFRINSAIFLDKIVWCNEIWFKIIQWQVRVYSGWGNSCNKIGHVLVNWMRGIRDWSLYFFMCLKISKIVSKD